MQITRHNYETFFLLYADDALQAEERAMVEVFIAQNEDLAMELHMLQATILPVEEITYTDKSFLYRDVVFEEKLTEKLLLKIDNELTNAENIELEQTIANNIYAQQMYKQLLGTKLNTAEQIVFNNKQQLYKKEPSKVVYFNWRAIAVAAACIGFGIFIGLQLLTKNVTVPTPSITKINTKNTDTINPAIESSKNVATNLLKKQVIVNNADIKAIAVKKIVANKQSTIIDNTQNKTKVTQQTQSLARINNDIQQINIVPKPAEILVAKLPNTIVINEQPIYENVVPLETMYSQTTSFTVSEKSGDKIFYIDEDEVKKTKAGGIFKKLKRLVERTANIKTGSSLQIAGFEIASK